jgi:protein-tyrosine phosphatase
VIDIHSHLLPEVDDGPKNWEIALEMCRMAAADGITHMVATPHANDRFVYDRPYLSGLLARLQQLAGDTPQLTLGCDFHLSYDNLQNALDRPHSFTIGDTRYLLVELSNYSVPLQISDCFIKLGDCGITPILTHPERNPILQQAPQRVLEWAEQGCLVQVTASALAGGWGERVRSIARWLLERGAVHVLASDAHDTKRRPPQLSAGRAASAAIVGQEIANALVIDNPAAILASEPVPYLPKPASGG